MNGLTKINDVKNRYDITARTLHYYEKMGLLKSIRDENSGYRLYDENAIVRLKQILILRKMNISIRDIGYIFTTNNSDRVLSVLDKKIDDIDNEVALLYELKEVILEFIRQMRQVDFYNEADVKTLFDKAELIETSLKTDSPDIAHLLDTSSHIDENVTSVVMVHGRAQNPLNVISLETVKCGPYRFIGKSVLARGHDQRGTAALFRSNWHNSAWVFEELDKLTEYTSDEKHNAALMTWEHYNDNTGELKTYTVGKFMKANTPVPDEMDYFDIPEMIVAKGWGKSPVGEYFGSSLDEGLFWDEIERQGKYKAAIWKFAAEVYPEVPKKDYTFGYYVGCEESNIMPARVITEEQKETINKILDKVNSKDDLVEIDFCTMKPFNRGSNIFEVNHLDDMISLKVDDEHHNGYLLSERQFHLPLVMKLCAKTDKMGIQFGCAALTIQLSCNAAWDKISFIDDRFGQHRVKDESKIIPVDEFVEIECLLDKQGIAVRVDGEIWYHDIEYSYVKEFENNKDYKRSGSVFFGTASGSTVTVKSLQVTEI